MPSLTLERANTIIAGAFAKAGELKLKPLAVCVLDTGGHVKAFQRQDGASMLRFEIGSGKAYGALAVGTGSRWLNNQAKDRPHFLEGLSGVSGGKVVPVPGGVLIKDAGGEILGRSAFPATPRTMMKPPPLPVSKPLALHQTQAKTFQAKREAVFVHTKTVSLSKHPVKKNAAPDRTEAAF